jgi:hypothetical protein
MLTNQRRLRRSTSSRRQRPEQAAVWPELVRGSGFSDLDADSELGKQAARQSATGRRSDLLTDGEAQHHKILNSASVSFAKEFY